jgi:hypothetical protein
MLLMSFERFVFMSETISTTVWYGELRASKGNAIIIRDPQLPVADRGRVYLYNTERDAIIQYDEAIVAPKLFPLDAQQRKVAEARFKASWQKALAQFMQIHQQFDVAEKAEKEIELDERLFQDDEDELDNE